MSGHQETVGPQKDMHPPKKPVDPSAYYEGEEDSPLFAPKDYTTVTTSTEMTKDQLNARHKASSTTPRDKPIMAD